MFPVVDKADEGVELGLRVELGVRLRGGVGVGVGVGLRVRSGVVIRLGLRVGIRLVPQSPGGVTPHSSQRSLSEIICNGE